MLGVLIGGCALLGLAVGSFLNVVIYRVPRHESIVRPRSKCPTCGVAIKERDNIPVLSWLILHGRCRACHAPISPRYLLVELAGCALFAGAAARLGYNWDLPAVLVLFASLLALSFIDIEHLVLPKVIVYPTIIVVIGLLAIAAGETDRWHTFLSAAICAAVWFAAFFVLNLASPRLLGFGDVRLSLVLGFSLGWFGWRYAVLGFFVANVIGAIIGLALIALKKITRDHPIPYGVFLALGTAFAIFVGPEIVPLAKGIH